MKPQWGSVIQGNCPEHKTNKFIRVFINHSNRLTLSSTMEPPENDNFAV